MLVGRQRHLLHRYRPGGVVLEALAGGGRLLFSERIHFCVCIRLVSSTSPRLCWSSVGGCFAAPLFVGGYFAAELCWRMLCRRRRWLEFSTDGCFAAVVGWSGGYFATLLGLQIFTPLVV